MEALDAQSARSSSSIRAHSARRKGRPLAADPARRRRRAGAGDAERDHRREALRRAVRRAVDARLRRTRRARAECSRRNGPSRSPGSPPTRSAPPRACSRSTKPAMLEWGCAIEHTPKCIQTVRAVSMLPALTGNIDVPGGWVFGMHGLGRFPSLIENLTPEANAKRLGADRFKMLGGEGADLPAAHIPTLLQGHARGQALSGEGVPGVRQQHAHHLCQHVRRLRRADEARLHGLRRSVHDADGRARRHRAAGGVVAGDSISSPALPTVAGQCRAGPAEGGADRRMQIGRGDLRRAGAPHEASGRHRSGGGRARRAARRRRRRHDLRRAQAEGLHQSPVQVPEIRGRRLQDADRQDRTLRYAASSRWAMRRCRATRSRRKARSARRRSPRSSRWCSRPAGGSRTSSTRNIARSTSCARRIAIRSPKSIPTRRRVSASPKGRGCGSRPSAAASGKRPS